MFLRILWFYKKTKRKENGRRSNTSGFSLWIWKSFTNAYSAFNVSTESLMKHHVKYVLWRLYQELMQDRLNQIGFSGDGSGLVLITWSSNRHVNASWNVYSVTITCQEIRQQNPQKWQQNSYKQPRLILIIILKLHIWLKN